MFIDRSTGVGSHAMVGGVDFKGETKVREGLRSVYYSDESDFWKSPRGNESPISSFWVLDTKFLFSRETPDPVSFPPFPGFHIVNDKKHYTSMSDTVQCLSNGGQVF